MAWRWWPIARSPRAASRTTGRCCGSATATARRAAQVCLRWLVQQNVAAIPRTSKLERLSENIEIFDFELSDEDMQPDFRHGKRQRPAHRFRFRAEMGLSNARAGRYALTGRHRDIDQVR